MRKPKSKESTSNNFRLQSKQSKQMVYNVFMYYHKRKINSESYEHKHDLNLTKIVSQATGLTQDIIKDIIREAPSNWTQEFEENQKKINNENETDLINVKKDDATIRDELLMDIKEEHVETGKININENVILGL